MNTQSSVYSRPHSRPEGLWIGRAEIFFSGAQDTPVQERAGTGASRAAVSAPSSAVGLSTPYAGAAQLVARYGDALADKVIVDISNPFNASATGLATPEGTSVAREIAAVAPATAHVVKAFNTVFGNVLAQGRPLDVFIAGDDAQAK